MVAKLLQSIMLPDKTSPEKNRKSKMRIIYSKLIDSLK